MSNKRPFIVGLTGGIGSGKTTVSKRFAAQGVQVIDADEINRTLLTSGSEALQRMTEHFGPSLLNKDGSLQRARLRSLIFNDKTEKVWVENLLHPMIRRQIDDEIDKSRRSWLLLSVPLLLENDAYDFVDRVLVVDVPEQVQIDRTRARDNISSVEVQRIIASQMPRAKRLAAADDVIDNTGDPAHLEQQVSKLIEQYEELANDHPAD